MLQTLAYLAIATALTLIITRNAPSAAATLARGAVLIAMIVTVATLHRSPEELGAVLNAIWGPQHP